MNAAAARTQGAAADPAGENWITEYNREITTGRVRVGKWVRLLYWILTQGIISGRYLYDAGKADRAITFIESYCRHSKGRSDLLKLELWQKALVSAIFGILNPETGLRQFTEVFILVGRKNGKSLLAAAIVAYSAYIDGEYGGEIYCVAPKLQQAEIVFNAFWSIVKQDEELNEISLKRRTDIYIEDFNTTVTKLAFNAKKADGFNPTLNMLDEMEAWPAEQGLKQYEVLTSGTGARREPLTISTSTAGYVNDGIFDELFKRGTAFLKGSGKENALLPVLYMIDDIEKWNTREELEKANPNMGVSVPWSFYVQQIAIAEGSLSKKIEFLTKYCNIKQNSAAAWLDFQTVEKAGGAHISLEDLRGLYVVAGIDLSQTTDLTAVSLLAEKNGKIRVYTQFFMPAERYKVASNEEGVPYQIMREKGFLQISGENQINLSDVFDFFVKLVKVYRILPLKVGYDRYSAQYLVEDMKAAGFHMDVVFQGPNLTSVMHSFEGDIKDGVYDLGDNSLLKAHLLNVAARVSAQDDRIEPVKIAKRAHIDGAVSIFDALAVRMKYHAEIGKQLKNAA